MVKCHAATHFQRVICSTLNIAIINRINIEKFQFPLVLIITVSNLRSPTIKTF